MTSENSVNSLKLPPTYIVGKQLKFPGLSAFFLFLSLTSLSFFSTLGSADLASTSDFVLIVPAQQ